METLPLLLNHGVERERKTTRALASPRLAGPGRARAGAMGAGARHLREWSAEIRILTLRVHGFLLLFLFFGDLACKFWFPYLI